MYSAALSRTFRARFLLGVLAFVCALFATAATPSPPLVADPPAVADLERRLAAAPAGEKSALLLDLSVALDSVDSTRALAAAQQARTAATTPRAELRADARISTLQRRVGRFADAYATVQAALARATELHDDEARAELLLPLARANWSLGDYPATMAAHQEVIALGGRIGRRDLVGRGHLGLSVVYAEMKDHARARVEEETALAIARETGDRQLEADALNNLGNHFRKTGDRAAARQAHEQSLALRLALGNRRATADSHVNLAEVARFSGDYATAIEHSSRALAIYEQLGITRNAANANLQLAASLRLAGRIDEARVRLATALALAEPLGSPGLMADCHRETSILAVARGDWRTAYEAERKRAAAADIVLGEKSREQLAALQARFDLVTKQEAITRLAAEKQVQLAEIRARESDLRASERALDRATTTRLALGIVLLALAGALSAIIVLQRARLRAERAALAESDVAKRAAEEADRVKTRFLGVATHDIRGPLGNIVNLTSTLRHDPPDPALRIERCDMINAEAQRVLNLVEDLLTTAALETGRLDLHCAPLDLADIVGSAIGTLRWQADAKRQVIHFAEPAPGAGCMVGDSSRLLQVASNLLGNAIKFSPSGGQIAVTLERPAGKIILTVRDQGPGLGEADIAQLFTPFQRLATHPTASESSHGLGLAIAHEIVQRHGGVIRVESKPGQGSVFIVEFATDRTAAT